MFGRVRRGHFLRDVVLDAAIGRRADLPFERQFEVFEGVHRHDVAAFEGLAVGGGGHVAAGYFADGAVFDDPVAFGDGIAAQTAPAGQGHPVEEQPPAGGLFRLGQRVREGFLLRRRRRGLGYALALRGARERRRREQAGEKNSRETVCPRSRVELNTYDDGACRGLEEGLRSGRHLHEANPP